MNNNHKDGLGRNGILALKLQDFQDLYEWQLDEYPDAKHKITFAVPLKEYYRLGLHCIENKTSIAGFCNRAIFGQLDSATPPQDLIFVQAMKLYEQKLNKKQKNKVDNFTQGGLF